MPKKNIMKENNIIYNYIDYKINHTFRGNNAKKQYIRL